MKRYLAILLLLMGVQLGYAQKQFTFIDRPPLYLEADGILIGQIKKAIKKDNRKTNYIYLAGGFINIRPTDYRRGAIIRFPKPEGTIDGDLFNYSRNPNLYYKTYFATSGGETNLTSATGSKKLSLLDEKLNTVYLRVNDVFNVDILDAQTDTLIKRYSITRSKVIPSLEVYNQVKHQKEVTQIQPLGNDPISIRANEELIFRPKKGVELQNERISYVLINLKTGKQKHYSDTEVRFPTLNANTEYELRYSYAIQPESIGIYRISVEPFWYQMPIFYGFIAGFAILTAILIIIFRLRGKVNLSQKKQTGLEQSILRLQSQLNPHFTFNALSSIQGLMNTNRVAEANDYLQDFSSLLRKTLAKSQQIFSTLDQELEMMQTYIRLEALRYNFSWTIELAPEINPSTVEIPTLLLQPLIENAIKHGIASLGTAGKLQVSCQVGEEDSLLISIKDNGKWMEEKTSTGYGLQLTNERISAINKLTKEKKIVLKFDKQNGTEASLLFHNWINN